MKIFTLAKIGFLEYKISVDTESQHPQAVLYCKQPYYAMHIFLFVSIRLGRDCARLRNLNENHFLPTRVVTTAAHWYRALQKRNHPGNMTIKHFTVLLKTNIS